MLVLSRGPGEAVMIGEDIVIRIVDVSHGKVRIGIEAPRETVILRDEIYDRIQAGEARTQLPQPARRKPTMYEALMGCAILAGIVGIVMLMWYFSQPGWFSPYTSPVSSIELSGQGRLSYEEELYAGIQEDRRQAEGQAAADVRVYSVRNTPATPSEAEIAPPEPVHHRRRVRD